MRRARARHDVLVAGGGPAGAAAAVLLAQRGRSVTLVHRPPGRRARLGETVPPGVVTPLVGLNLWEEFLAAGHVIAPGTVASWGSPIPHERDSLFDAYGSSWHLDRAGFDAMLLTAATHAGVQVRPGTVLGCHLNDADGWTVRMAGPGAATVCARWLVDASGRGSRLARNQGARRIRYDRLLGLARLYRMPDTGDSRMVIEATEPGWWYFAPQPEGRAVAVLFTDADLMPATPASRAQCWDDLLEATRLVRDRLGSGSATSSLRVAPADSGSLDLVCGRGWLAVGDAAQSWDPLSGQGIMTALGSAWAAVEAIESGLMAGAAMQRYASQVRAGFHDYLRERTAQYGRETRWTDSPFWRRRTVGAHAG